MIFGSILFKLYTKIKFEKAFQCIVDIPILIENSWIFSLNYLNLSIFKIVRILLSFALSVL